MDKEFNSNVFVLSYSYSEEDHGILCIYKDFKDVNFLKSRLESIAKEKSIFIRFRIDVYNVLPQFIEKDVDMFSFLSMRI